MQSQAKIASMYPKEIAQRILICYSYKMKLPGMSDVLPAYSQEHNGDLLLYILIVNIP